MLRCHNERLIVFLLHCFICFRLNHSSSFVLQFDDFIDDSISDVDIDDIFIPIPVDSSSSISIVSSDDEIPSNRNCKSPDLFSSLEVNLNANESMSLSPDLFAENRSDNSVDLFGSQSQSFGQLELIKVNENEVNDEMRPTNEDEVESKIFLMRKFLEANLALNDDEQETFISPSIE